MKKKNKKPKRGARQKMSNARVILHDGLVRCSVLPRPLEKAKIRSVIFKRWFFPWRWHYDMSIIYGEPWSKSKQWEGRVLGFKYSLSYDNRVYHADIASLHDLHVWEKEWKDIGVNVVNKV